MELFIIKNDEQLGPFTIDQLGGMDIQPDTPVWHKGLDNWTVAGEVDELRDLLVYKPQTDEEQAEEKVASNNVASPPQWSANPPVAQAAVAAPAVQQVAPQEPEPAKPKKSRTALWVTLGLVGVLTIVLAVSNPNKEDHCREITSVSRTWVNETVDNFHMNNLMGGLIKTASTWLIRSAVDENVRVDNYFLFSIGYIDTGAEKTRVSFGILGNVFTFNKDQLDEKVKEIMSQYFQDAIGIGSIFSFNNDNANDALISGIVSLIGGNLIGEIPDGTRDTVVINEDEINAEDRADAALTPPSMGEEIIRGGAKMIIREIANYLIKKADSIGR